MSLVGFNLPRTFLHTLRRTNGNLRLMINASRILSVHCFHSSQQLRQQSDPRIQNGKLKLGDTYLELLSYFPKTLKFWYIWLRDHCQCEKCYTHITHQRNLNILNIPEDIKPKNCLIEDNKLLIEWPDKHISQYSLDWLFQNCYSNYYERATNKKVFLWNNEVESLVTPVDAKTYLEDDSSVKEVLQSLVNFGIGIVKNVPATVEATEEIVTRISHVQRTMFGEMWVLDDKFVHSDTAYTNVPLCAHTDNTYFTEPAGLQVFHCLEHDGEGGRTLLVDGFRAANDVKEKYPESYRRLCTTPIEFQYLEKGKHYSYTGPILTVNHVTKEMEHIRFNLLDRAPFCTVPASEIEQFYRDVRLLAAAVSEPGGEWWLKLSPGLVLLIDNWRVLHGREGFSGYRKLAGCYVGRSEFLSKARVLGVI